MADAAENAAKALISRREKTGSGSPVGTPDCRTPKQSIARPLGTYALVPETAERPAWTVGLFTDSLGGGRTGVFTSVAKDIQNTPGVPMSLYVGSARVSNENRTRFLTGASYQLAHRVNLSAQFDGRYVNLGLVGQVGTIGGVPVRLGIVAARGNQLGLLAATVVPLGGSGH